MSSISSNIHTTTHSTYMPEHCGARNDCFTAGRMAALGRHLFVLRRLISLIRNGLFVVLGTLSEADSTAEGGHSTGLMLRRLVLRSLIRE